MTDRPIIFSGPMIRALLEGTKTQTRRLLPFQPPDGFAVSHLYDKPAGVPQVSFNGEISGIPGTFSGRCLYAPGDRLYVRENFSNQSVGGVITDFIQFEANEDCLFFSKEGWRPEPLGNAMRATKWRPSIHHPKHWSRITLTVEAVKVERLQSISDADVRAEGIPEAAIDKWRQWLDPRDCAGSAFKELWDSLNAKRAPWDSNPWVVAVSFSVEKINIDQR